MATPTTADIALLISILTGQSYRSLTTGPTALTDADVVSITASIANVLDPDQVFQATDIAAFAGDRADLYTEAEALAYGGTLTPLEVFSGAPGLVKLEAWAAGAGWTKI
jgi:hypothetical protein